MRKTRSELRKPLAPRASRALIAISLLSLAPQDAFAYVDPGSGMLLIQGLLALIGGVVVFVKNPVAACKRLWARLFTKPTPRDQ